MRNRTSVLLLVLLVFETTAGSWHELQPQSTWETDNHGSTNFRQKTNENTSINCSRYLLVSREQWGAKPPKDGDYFNFLDGVPYVFYHHTNGEECDSTERCAEITRMWQVCHQCTRGWDDIAYSFLIGGDGSVYEGRGWTRVGAHTLGYNNISLSLGFIGNYSNKVPNSKMLTAAEMLIECGIAMGAISASYTLHGQRDANCRECPGEAFYQHITTLQSYGGKLSRFICTEPPGPC